MAKQSRRAIAVESLQELEQDFFSFDVLKERFNRSPLVQHKLLQLPPADTGSIQPKLTKLGRHALAQLNLACVWSLDERCMDVEETINYYDRHLGGEFLYSGLFAQISGLPRDQFDDLQKRAVFRKLSSHMIDDKWYRD